MQSKVITSLSRNRLLLGWMLGVCGVCGTARGQYDPDWVRNFRLGAVAGFNIKADLRLTASSFQVGNYRPGQFDDGYVIADPNNTSGNDFTSNWGYESAGQYNADAQTLTFHRTTEFSAGEIQKDKSDESFPIGFDLEYGGYPWRWERVRLGINFGFGFLPMSFTQRFTMSDGTVNREAYTYSTDVWNGGTPPPIFPQPGHQGSANGGWVIDGTPPESSAPAGSSNASAEGEHTLDVSLFTFRLGPSLFLDLHPRVGLAIGAGPALGFIAGDYEFDDLISIEGGDEVRSRGSFGVSDLVYGGYVNATLTYHATLNGDFYISAQYMPLGSAEFIQGGRSAKLDLSGAIYLSGGINWPF